MIYTLGQKVIINFLGFNGVTGIIIKIPLYNGLKYYRVRFDQKAHNYTDGLFTEKELELIGPENILDYIKLRLTGEL